MPHSESVFAFGILQNLELVVPFQVFVQGILAMKNISNYKKCLTNSAL